MKSSDRSDRGAVLMWVAGMLVALLGASAFAVDLGWLYLNTSRLQRAADAAALAGVVNLPSFPDRAATDAADAAGANRFPIGGNTTIELTQLPENQLQVRLNTMIDTFFLKALGFSNFAISRISTAQYIQPVPLGSPFPSFGDGLHSFWGAISGPYTAKIHGDAHQALCDWSTSPSTCIDSSSAAHASHFGAHELVSGDIDSDTRVDNPSYRPTGYFYAIEVSPGTSFLEVELYDPRFMRRTPTITPGMDEAPEIWRCGHVAKTGKQVNVIG